MSAPEPATRMSTASPAVAHPEVRAADADRERVVELLRAHAGEGRLAVEELSERLDEAYAARTLGELERPLRELPGAFPAGAPASPTRPRIPEALGRLVPLALLLAVLLGGAAAGLGFPWPVLFAAPWALGVARGRPVGAVGCSKRTHRRAHRSAV